MHTGLKAVLAGEFVRVVQSTQYLTNIAFPFCEGMKIYFAANAMDRVAAGCSSPESLASTEPTTA